VQSSVSLGGQVTALLEDSVGGTESGCPVRVPRTFDPADAAAFDVCETRRDESFAALGAWRTPAVTASRITAMDT
jgi:hypothetical protein